MAYRSVYPIHFTTDMPGGAVHLDGPCVRHPHGDGGRYNQLFQGKRMAKDIART